MFGCARSGLLSIVPEYASYRIKKDTFKALLTLVVHHHGFLRVARSQFGLEFGAGHVFDLEDDGAAPSIGVVIRAGINCHLVYQAAHWLVRSLRRRIG